MPELALCCRGSIGGGEDLTIEILLRLPPKSLMRFKSVTKNWSDLISSHRFSLLWQGSKSAGVSLLLRHGDLLKSIPLHGGENEIVPSNGSGGGILVRGIRMCSNGLVLCYSPSDVYHVYNPATRQFATLPSLHLHIYEYDICLLFDPFKSPHYKVVVVGDGNPIICGCNPFIEIYCSETNSWRNWGKIVFNKKSFWPGVVWNGGIFWLRRNLNQKSLWFDFDEEREVPSPPKLTMGTFGSEYIEESGGHLNYIVYSRFPGVEFVVYEMERDCSDWFFKFRLDLGLRDVLAHERVQFSFSLLCLVRDEIEEDESCLVLCVPGQIISFNFKDKAPRKVLDLKALKHYGTKDVHQYTPTIFRV